MLPLNLMFVVVSLFRVNIAPVMFLSYSGPSTICETEMAYLDDYAIALENNLQQKAYIIVYGGRRDTAPHELKQRRERIKRYLVENRGLGSERVQVVGGGFREQVTIELWMVDKGNELPEAKPTVSPKDVRLRRTKWQFKCSSFY